MTYVVHFGILVGYAKNLWKMFMFNGALGYLKFQLTPSEAKTFFNIKYDKIYIKRCY